MRRRAPLTAVSIGLAACVTAAASASSNDDRPRITPAAWVHIAGEADESGLLAPRRIHLQPSLSKALIRGRVAASEHGGRRLTLLNFLVVTDSATTIYRGPERRPASFGELIPGVYIEAKVVRRGKRLVATRIRIEDPRDHTSSIDAPVDRVDASSGRIVVLGTPLAIAANIPIVDERTASADAAAVSDSLRRDDDDQQVRPLQIGNAVTVGGRIETTLLDRTDFDLTGARPDRNERVDSRLQLLATAALSSTFEAYAKVTSARRIPVFDRRGPATGGGDLRVEEAFLTIHEPAGLRLTAQAGRQRFRDAREWFFDEYLDAVRVRTELSRWALDVAIARGLFRPEQDDRESRDAQHVIASATTRLADATVTAVLVSRRDGLSDESPTWIGGSVTAPVTARGRFWSLAALRRGRAGEVRLRGWAVDIGTTWRLPFANGPSLTAAVAAASGDDRPGDGVDGAFHQTDLHDNKARFGGLKRFAYYGEALRPELSDVSILTLGGSAIPRRKWSVDVVYHRYLRRSAAAWAGDMDVTASADGAARHLGDEVDAIVASQAIRGIDLSLIVGVFRPGAAFPAGRSPAVVWRPQVRFYF